MRISFTFATLFPHAYSFLPARFTYSCAPSFTLCHQYASIPFPRIANLIFLIASVSPDLGYALCLLHPKFFPFSPFSFTSSVSQCWHLNTDLFFFFSSPTPIPIHPSTISDPPFALAPPAGYRILKYRPPVQPQRVYLSIRAIRPACPS